MIQPQAQKKMELITQDEYYQDVHVGNGLDVPSENEFLNYLNIQQFFSRTGSQSKTQVQPQIFTSSNSENKNQTLQPLQESQNTINKFYESSNQILKEKEDLIQQKQYACFYVIRNREKLFSSLQVNILVRRFISRFTRIKKQYSNLKAYHFSVIHDESTSFINDNNIDNQDFSRFQRQQQSRWQRFLKKGARWLQTVGESLLCVMIQQKFPVIQPEQMKKMLWDIILTVSRILLLVIVPAEMAFSNKLLFDTFLIPMYFGLILLFIDIILCFNTAYFECGQVVNKRTQIIQNYISNGLLPDLISAVLLLGVTVDQSTRHVHFIPASETVIQFIYNMSKPQRSWQYFLLVVVFLQLINIQKVIGKIEESFHFSKQSASLIDLVIIMIDKLFTGFSILNIYFHVFGILWEGIPMRMVLRIGQVKLVSKIKVIRSSTYFHFIMQVLQQYLLDMEILFQQVLQLISIIICKDQFEMLITICFMFCACFQISYFVSSLFGILSQLNARSQELRSKLRAINIYMQKKHVSHQLQYKVRQYLTYYWQEQSNEQDSNEEEIIGQLSAQLKDDLMMEANSLVLKDCVLFSKYFSADLKKKCLKIIKSLTLFPETTVESQLKEDQIDDQFIFFIELGQILVQHEGTKKPLNQSRVTSLALLEKGQNFGMENFITGQVCRETFKSIGFTQLLYISRRDFLNILQELPDDYEEFCILRDRPLSQTLGFKCFSCNSIKHTVKDCQLHYVPDTEQIIKKEQWYVEQQREKNHYDRKQFTRFQTLADLEFLTEVAEAFQYCNEQIVDTLYDDNQYTNHLTENMDSSMNSLKRPVGIGRSINLSKSSKHLQLVPILEKDDTNQVSEKSSDNSSSDQSSSLSSVYSQQQDNKEEKDQFTFKNNPFPLKNLVVMRRQSRRLEELKPILNDKQKKLLFKGAVKKVQNAVHKISALTSMKNASKLRQLKLRKLHTIQIPTQDKLIILPSYNQQTVSQLKNTISNETSLFELLLIKGRIIQAEKEQLVSSDPFETSHDYKIYMPEHNLSIISLVEPKTKYPVIIKWLKYMLYPWQNIQMFKLGVQADPNTPPQRKRVKGRKNVQFHFQKKTSVKDFQRNSPEKRRKTKAFELIEKFK